MRHHRDAALPLVPAIVIVAVFTGPTVYAADGAKRRPRCAGRASTVVLVFVVIVSVAVVCPARSVTVGGNDT